MRSISAQTRALIELLEQPVGLWQKLTGGGRNEAELLSQIADTGEQAAVLDITSFVLSERHEVASAAAAAVNKLLASVTPEELARLDLSFRARSPYGGRYRLEWHRLTPARLNRIENFGSHSVALLGLASFHESGYVREEATNRLERTSDGTELPFLLIRLNDWVRNVRETARRAVISRLRPDYAASFVANLPLLARLEQTERSDQRPIIEAVESLLKSVGCRDALLQGLASRNRTIRRMSFSLALVAEDADQPSIVDRALKDNDTVIRLSAARIVSAGFEDQRLDEFLSIMSGDHFMPVRREAIRAFVSRLPERAPLQLRRALLDPHASMREEARYHLRKSETVDFAAFYRHVLASDTERNLFSAIGGIGETGSAPDDRVLVSYAQHRSAKIRRAAVRGLSGLNGDAHIPVFIDALRDAIPGVSREARKALAGRMAVAGSVPLWEIFSTSALPHVRRNVLHLLSRLGKWDAIFFLIMAACDPVEVVAESGRFYIGRWLAQFNRSFTSPTREQLARLEGTLRECGHFLDETVREQLWFSMKGF